jgi:hypothetical protein
MAETARAYQNCYHGTYSNTQSGEKVNDAESEKTNRKNREGAKNQQGQNHAISRWARQIHRSAKQPVIYRYDRFMWRHGKKQKTERELMKVNDWGA